MKRMIFFSVPMLGATVFMWLMLWWSNGWAPDFVTEAYKLGWIVMGMAFFGVGMFAFGIIGFFLLTEDNEDHRERVEEINKYIECKRMQWSRRLAAPEED